MQQTNERLRRVRLFVGFVAALAVFLVMQLLAVGARFDPGPRGIIPAVLFSVLLFLGETQQRLWMRWGDHGQITPGWAFAYALVLVGSPIGAVVVMVLTNLYIDVRHKKGALKVVFNVSQVAISLSVAELVLHTFGVRVGIHTIDQLPMRHAIGILLAGVATFVTNGVLLSLVLSIYNGVRITSIMDRSYVMSVAADGALLALAPVFVIAIEFSTLMVPLLAVTSFLVYHSARNALRSEHAANHDPLTMLLNRRAFDERVGKAAEEALPEQQALVLLMDLDRFKDINDRLGHPVGDRLLRSFAEKLERVMPANAAVSRLGGDEFAVLVTGITDTKGLHAEIAGWHAELSQPHDLSGFPVTSAVSVGVALAPEHGRSAAALMTAADVAMYRAKQHRTGVEFASHVDGANDVGRVSLLADLREALGTPQLFAEYQPMVRVTDGAIESVEALIRWNHPLHGPVPPNDFIGMAEHTDLIGPLTEMMFRTAMTEMLTIDPLPRLCLNVASANVADRRFAATVLRIMSEVGFPTANLEIEIIERDMVINSERAELTLATLRRHGVRVAIDDFGTGYSSLSTLRTLDADRLKIDQEFTAGVVASPADELIVSKLIEIAHALGLDVVGEGVESYEVWERLAHLGCDVIQGYAVARPMPLKELRAWITTHEMQRNSIPTVERFHHRPALKVLSS